MQEDNPTTAVSDPAAAEIQDNPAPAETVPAVTSERSEEEMRDLEAGAPASGQDAAGRDAVELVSDDSAATAHNESVADSPVTGETPEESTPGGEFNAETSGLEAAAELRPTGAPVPGDSGLGAEGPAYEMFPEELLPEFQGGTVLSADLAALRALVEAVVYITEEPVTVAQIAGSVGQPTEVVERALAEIIAEFERPEHGVAVREVAGGYKMATKPEHHEAVRAFVRSLKPPLKLSLAALETLAVVAYKQPVTAPEIMEIRGVQGAGVLKTLLDRKLIQAAGRKNVIGKPVLYKTSKEFMVQFGLKDLSELPTLKEFEEIRRMAIPDVSGPGNEEPARAASTDQPAEGSVEPIPSSDEPSTEDSNG